MSNKFFFQNIDFQNAPKNQKQKRNTNINQTNKNFNQNGKNKNINSLNHLKNNYNFNNNERYNNNVHNIDNVNYSNNNFKKSDNNKFISISEIPEVENDNNYDNCNYISIIQTSIVEKQNPKKIKTVDANKYINSENNSLSTFNDFKLKLLNKRNEFNSPFIFYKNNLDLSNSKKVEDEKNYQIKRYRYLTAYRYSFNPVIRRKNSKIIQKWWRNKINPKIEKRKKIIKLQSLFRGYITRKDLNDIICISVIYQNFINKLRHALGNFVHRNYFPKRYYKKKYAMEKIFPIKLKLFLRRWKTINEKYNQREKTAEFLFKNRNEKRYTLIILKSFFDIWKLKCEEFRKNEDKDLSLKNQHQKYTSIAKLFNIYEKIGNKTAYNLCKDNIHKYLVYIFHNRYIKKIMEIYNKYNLKRKLKKYFDLWRKNNFKEKEKNLKLKILANEIKAQIRKNDKDFIRNNLNSLRSKANLQTINNLKRAKKEFLFPKGINHIIRCTRKNIIRLIFKKFIRKRNIQKKLLKIINKKMMRYYLSKWNKKIKKLLYEDKCLLYLKKIICKISHLSNNLILGKYFNRWKNKAFFNKYKDNKINIYNNFCNSLKKYINKNKNLVKNKKVFLKNKLNRYINTKGNIIKKKLLKCFNNYINKDKILALKKAFNKWKKYVQYCRLYDLKAKNLETVSRLTKLIYDSKKLSKNLYEWKNKKEIINLNNKYQYNNAINKLMTSLDKIKNNRMKQLFNNMRIAKDGLMKKIILKNISNKYEKNKLYKYFNKYKINIIKLKNKYKLSNLDKLSKLKTILNSKIKKVEKNNFGALKKNLFKWYLISKLINEDNYKKFLINLKKGINIINSKIIQKFLKKPFEAIKIAEVNKKNIALQRLRKYFIKNDKKNLRNGFYKFYKNIKRDSKNILKSNIIYNLKLKKEQIRNKTLLTKYFNKWKMINKIYKRQRDKTIDLINNIYIKIIKRKKEKQFLNNLKNIRSKYYLNNLTKIFFKLYRKVGQRQLSKSIEKWKNNARKLSLLMNNREKGYTVIYRTLSKVYAYKKLDKDVIPILINRFIKRYYKEFFDKFKKFFLLKINCNYKAKIKNGIISKKYNFKFKKTIKPNYPTYNCKNSDEENKNIEENKINVKPSRYKIPRSLLNRRKSNYAKDDDKLLKNIVLSNSIDNYIKKDKFYYERLMPYLVNYLNDLRCNRLRLVFRYFHYIKNNNLFCILLKSWVKKQNYNFKKMMIQKLIQSNIKQKLFLLMRKNIIHKLASEYLVEINKRNQLLILVHKTKIYKIINKKRRVIRFLRIWRVYVKFLRDRAAQMERFEKSFSETYEKLSDSIFVDIGDEKSVQTQVMGFLDKITQDEKMKIKNNLAISQSSLNSYLSAKNIKNDLLNSYNNNNNITFHNDNEYNISFSKLYSNNIENEDKYLNNSNNNSIVNIKSSVFSKNYKNN